ncbi:hypothetical protein KO537_08035 [Shewanella sp. NKUCC01_JLK]|jgi:hypothetical protein|uniref:hypothetical protein n=1 Tax=Shewanella sp. NKUCC01_JLK TaxID=2842123 RepID=UPI001C5BA3AD|nr:hypothetical protein [Shewanella sp. NKUCC01_JLK]MBW3514665.1 hypothetical protein [Shewanella sp. NKUCC01_JLK]
MFKEAALERMFLRAVAFYFSALQGPHLFHLVDHHRIQFLSLVLINFLFRCKSLLTIFTR